MQRLKNKVFFLIILILTLSILSFLGVLNIHNYIEEKNSVSDILETATNRGRTIESTAPAKGDSPAPGSTGKSALPDAEAAGTQPDSNIRFVDSVIYTVLLDENNGIKAIINHSDNGLSYDQIESIASGLLQEINTGTDTDTDIIHATDPESPPGHVVRHIGNLYFEDNSYFYIPEESLTIFDNLTVRAELIHSLKVSLLIFVIMELLIIAAAALLTSWIIKPVQESFDKQKQFIADASHELKTPLSVIIACSEMLEEDPGRTKWLRNIRTEADRMNDLIMDLLNLASSEQPEQMPLQKGDLSKTVELAALTFEGKAFESNVRLECDITPGISIDMHENSIRQLVEILLDNAVKHSDIGETVHLSMKNHHGRPELTVTNSGEGIPAGEEQKIFERFYRSDKSRSRSEGRFGLGLAIAGSIMKNHNGTITAASSDGRTTFTARF